MIYADYAYYIGTYCGTAVPEGEFTRLSRKASAYIDTVTHGNAEKAEDSKVKAKLSDACCAVVEELYQQEQGGEIASESNHNVSRTYVTSGKNAQRRMYDAAVMYLANTGLLYAGCL